MTATRGDVRALTRKALFLLLEPLTAFAIDAGLSAGDMYELLREAAVRGVARRQLEISHRVNISGIAATTGIPRAEISRILKQKNLQENRPPDRRQQSTNRILAAWYAEPKFANMKGQPATLKIYGRGATFESLVRSYGRGIPSRAVLDELLRSRVVEVLPGQRVRAIASLAVYRELTPQVIKAFGDRASDLLWAMLSNIRTPETPRFLATVAAPVETKKILPLMRKELSTRSAEFLSGIKGTLAVAPRARGSSTVGVTIFYHETSRANFPKPSLTSRTNFRRRSSRKS